MLVAADYSLALALIAAASRAISGGTISDQASTGRHPDGADLEGCAVLQAMNGTRPPR